MALADMYGPHLTQRVHQTRSSHCLFDEPLTNMTIKMVVLFHNIPCASLSLLL
ncbi:hypothetical protein Syun_001863 [Stephania yunnanensis]|uniref:Uncharacterized protein n=1 Tax=Stephania yunnanensis TaxID=152371 RepID=A0AAP0LEK6_9MAGN